MVSTREVRLLQIAQRQHSVFTRQQARRCRFTPDEIDGRLRRGLWIPLHRCVYRVRGAPLTFEAEALAAVFAAGDGAVLSHDSAARLWKLEGEWSSRTHVTVPNRKGIVVPGVVIHQPRVEPEKTKIGAIPVTTCVRTLMDVGPGLGDVALEDAIDDARRRKLVSAEKMLVIVEKQRRPGRRGLKRLEAILRVRVGKPVSGSSKENALARLFEDAGLPAPVPQYVIREPDGTFVAQPDFAYPDAKLAIEFDSYEFHGSRRQWEDGKIRESWTAALGWRQIAVTHLQMGKLPDWVVRNVWRALAVAWTADPRQTPASAASARPRRR